MSCTMKALINNERYTAALGVYDEYQNERLARRGTVSGLTSSLKYSK